MRRDGFTLIEMMLALVIFAVVILGMATATGRFIRVVGDADRTALAVQLAMDRVQLVQSYPAYPGIDSAFAGTESNPGGISGATRETIIVPVQGNGVDFKRVTVLVALPGLPTVVRRTVTVGAP